MTPEMEQHFQPVGKRERRDIGVKIRVTLREIVQGRNELFIEHEAVAAGMGGDDGDPFVERGTQPVWFSDGLILSDEAELKADVAEKRELALGQRAIERFVLEIGRVEVLSIGQDFDQNGSGIGATTDFLYRVLPLRVDRRAG